MVPRNQTAVAARRVERRRVEIAREIAALGPPLPGSLVERHTRCGNLNCRCRAEEPQLHGPYLTWTRKVDNRTVTRTISPDQAERYRQAIENGRALRRLVNELEQLGVQALTTDPSTTKT